MIKIVILNGNPTAGKNTFAELVEDFYPVIDHISYVDFTRNMLDKMGVDYSGKTAKDRQLIEAVNNALENHSDIPFIDICSFTYKAIQEHDSGILFVDIRKPENIKRFCERFPDAITVFVDDGKETSDVTLSDSVVKNMEYKYTVINTGSIDDLKLAALVFINEITRDKTNMIIDEDLIELW